MATNNSLLHWAIFFFLKPKWKRIFLAPGDAGVLAAVPRPRELTFLKGKRSEQTSFRTALLENTLSHLKQYYHREENWKLQFVKLPVHLSHILVRTVQQAIKYQWKSACLCNGNFDSPVTTIKLNITLQHLTQEAAPVVQKCIEMCTATLIGAIIRKAHDTLIAFQLRHTLMVFKVLWIKLDRSLMVSSESWESCFGSNSCSDPDERWRFRRPPLVSTLSLVFPYSRGDRSWSWRAPVLQVFKVSLHH